MLERLLTVPLAEPGDMGGEKGGGVWAALYLD